MNVTKDKFNDRKFHNESKLQMVSAEQREYVNASVCQRITENNTTIANLNDTDLLEKILHKDNMNNAYKKVKTNKGVGGVDKMSVDELF